MIGGLELRRLVTVYVTGALVAGALFLLGVFAYARPYEFATFAALLVALAWLLTRLPWRLAASLSSLAIALRIWRDHRRSP